MEYTTVAKLRHNLYIFAHSITMINTTLALWTKLKFNQTAAYLETV